jgi:hypothetical protein
MKIRINDQEADVTLENEKTLGEVITNMAQWFESSGHRLSGVSVDGEPVHHSSLNGLFIREITGVELLELYAVSLAELTAESLSSLREDTEIFENLDFNERKTFFANWKESVQANFISEQMPDLYSAFVNLFQKSEINPRVVFSMTEERLREVKEPMDEATKIQPLLEETCERLVNLALDIQTGKDSRAAQTIQLFSGISEKIIRLIKQLGIQGYMPVEANGEKPLVQIMNEFGNLIKELSDAYEKHDTVLVGDIAEYEAAPKLQELYSSIMNKSRQPAQAEK